jgi:DsbC/DsbD-like thiol-disulfide interchange protein
MIRISLLLVAFLAAAGAPGGALAAASSWEVAEGGRVRLITSGPPDASGHLRGALQIDLKPGWKTYWREPGSSGVPPSIDTSPSPHVLSAVLDFPAPERHFDGDLPWSGYGHPVSFPVTFTVEPGTLAPIEVDVFIGICETICIPLAARLTLDPSALPEDSADAAQVANAFDGLPQAASDGFGVTFREAIDGKAMFEATLPPDALDADLFLAAEGYVFGLPDRHDSGGRTVFAVPVERPDSPAGAIHYTLVTSAGSVSGRLEPF